MSIIDTITGALSPMGLPVAVGMYKVQPGEKYPDAYIVITPLDERNDDIADDEPLTETNAADVKLYKRGDYQVAKDQMKSLLKTAGLFLEDRRYLGYEKDTDHHSYVITVEQIDIV